LLRLEQFQKSLTRIDILGNTPAVIPMMVYGEIPTLMGFFNNAKKPEKINTPYFLKEFQKNEEQNHFSFNLC
jgi:hypothetical protein